MPEPTIALNDDQIESFHKDGFLSLDAITSQEELEMLRKVRHLLTFFD